jgi:hypothetical protein
MAEVVEDDSLVTAGSKKPSHGSAYISGTAGNQSFHKK